MHEPPGPGRRERASALTLGAALLLVLAAYSNALPGAFVWDDHMVVLGDSRVVRPGGPASYFSRPFWQADPTGTPVGLYYRPLVTLSYALDYRLWGANPAGFHATNLLAHLLNVVLVFFCARFLGSPPGLAAAAAAAWGVFPRLTESVTWISGRSDVFACTCVLAALLAWQAAPRFSVAITLAFCAAGVLYKETALAVLAALAAGELARRKAGDQSSRGTALFAGLGALSAAYVAARLFLIPHAPLRDPLGAWARCRLVLQSLGTYASLALDPFHPSTGTGTTGGFEPVRAVAGAVVLVLAVVAGFHVWRSGRPAAVAFSALAAGALAPVLHLVPLPGSTVAADRFLTIPLAALAVLLAGCAAIRADGRRVRAATAALALLGAAFAVGTWRRNAEWSDELSFWAAEVRRAPPGRLLPQAELAAVFERERRFDDAIRLRAGILSALSASGSLARGARIQLEGQIALDLAELGCEDEARRLLEGLDRLDPGSPLHRLHIVRLELQRLRISQASIDNALLRARFPAFAPAIALQALIDGMREVGETASPPAASALPAGSSRARRLEALGSRAAVREWTEALRGPVSRDDFREGVAYVLKFGSRAEAREAVGRFKERFPAAPESGALAADLDFREARERRLDVVARELAPASAPLGAGCLQKTAGSS